MLSIILPTYNEAANLPELLERITAELKKDAYEVIVVDDNSPDGTWQVAEKLTTDYPNLRVLHRVGRKGLSSAVVEGFAMAKGDIFLVMDADLQHDPALITQLRTAIENGAGIAVASRYMEGGNVGEWVRGRRILSKTATFLARTIPRVTVSDPMSGFFAVRRDAYAAAEPYLWPTGFKILLEILAFLPRGTTTANIPLQFHMRKHGESKLNAAVEALFLLQLVRIVLYRFQWQLFWLVVAGTIMVLAPRAYALLPLYTQVSVRAQAQHTLGLVAEENGWLLSDIDVRSVTSSQMQIIYRPHYRGSGEATCAIARFGSSQFLPCASPL